MPDLSLKFFIIDCTFADLSLKFFIIDCTFGKINCKKDSGFYNALLAVQ